MAEDVSAVAAQSASALQVEKKAEAFDTLNVQVEAEAEADADAEAADGDDNNTPPAANVVEESTPAEQGELLEQASTLASDGSDGRESEAERLQGKGVEGEKGVATGPKEITEEIVPEVKATPRATTAEQGERPVARTTTSSAGNKTTVSQGLDQREVQRDASDEEERESGAAGSGHVRSSSASSSSSSWDSSSYAPLGARLSTADGGDSELQVKFAPSLEDVSRAADSSNTKWWAGLQRQMYSYGDLPKGDNSSEPNPEHRRLISELLRRQLSLAFAGSDRDHNHLVHMDTEVFEASLVVLHNRISEQLFPSTTDTSNSPLKHNDGDVADKQSTIEESKEPPTDLQRQPTVSNNPTPLEDTSAVVPLKGVFEYRVEGSAADQQRVAGYKSMFDELRSQDSIFAASQLPSDLVSVFSMIDTNDDGEVTEEEFVAFVQQHAQQVVFDTEERNIPQIRVERVQWCLDQLHAKHNSKMDRFFALHLMRNMLLKHKDAATKARNVDEEAGSEEFNETLDGGDGDKLLLTGSSPANYAELSFQLTLNAFGSTPAVQNLWYFCGCQTRAPAVVFEKASWQDDGLTDIGLTRLLVATTKERENLESRVSAAKTRLAGVQDALAQLKLDFFDRRNQVRSRSGELQAVIATCHVYKVSPQCTVQSNVALNALQEVFEAAGTEKCEHELETLVVQPVDRKVMDDDERVSADTDDPKQPQHTIESSHKTEGIVAEAVAIHAATAQTPSPTKDDILKQEEGGENRQEDQTEHSDQKIPTPVADPLQILMTSLTRRDRMLAALRAQVDAHDSPMISLSMDFKSSFRKSLFRAQSVVGEAVEEVKQRIATAKRRQEKKAAVARSRDEAVLAALASHKALMDVIEAQKRADLQCERLKGVVEVLSKRLQEVRTAEHDLATAKADREARAAALLEKQVRRIDGLAQRPHVVGVSMHHGVSAGGDNVRASTSHQAKRVRSAKHTRSVSVPVGLRSGSDGNSFSHRRTSSDAFMISLSKSSVASSTGASPRLGDFSMIKTTGKESHKESHSGDDAVKRAILRAQRELDDRQAGAMAAQLEQQQRRPADELNKQKHEPLQRADRDDHRLTNDLSPLFAISAAYREAFERVVVSIHEDYVGVSAVPFFAYRITRAEQALALAILDFLTTQLVAQQSQRLQFEAGERQIELQQRVQHIRHGSVIPSAAARSPSSSLSGLRPGYAAVVGASTAPPPFGTCEVPALGDLVQRAARLTQNSLEERRSGDQGVSSVIIPHLDLIQTLRILASAMDRGSNPQIASEEAKIEAIVAVEEAAAAQPGLQSEMEVVVELEDAGGDKVRPLVRDGNAARILAPLAAATLSLVTDTSFAPRDTASTPLPLHHANHRDLPVQELECLSAFILSRISTQGVQRLVHEHSAAFDAFPASMKRSALLLDARARAAEAARKSALVRRMKALKASASANAAWHRIQAAADARKSREAEEAALRRQQRAAEIKEEAIRRREQEIADRKRQATATERRHAELKRAAKERAKAKAAAKRREKRMARKNQAETNEKMRQQRLNIQRSLRRSRERRRVLDKRADKVVKQERKSPRAYFHNGMDGGRVHEADPEWVHRYGAFNPKPTVEAYADFRLDGRGRHSKPRRVVHTRPPAAADAGRPNLPPLSSQNNKHHANSKRQKATTNRSQNRVEKGKGVGSREREPAATEEHLPPIDASSAAATTSSSAQNQQ